MFCSNQLIKIKLRLGPTLNKLSSVEQKTTLCLQRICAGHKIVVHKAAQKVLQEECLIIPSCNLLVKLTFYSCVSENSSTYSGDLKFGCEGCPGGRGNGGQVKRRREGVCIVFPPATRTAFTPFICTTKKI